MPTEIIMAREAGRISIGKWAEPSIARTAKSS
jgi:hypothetical protein